MPRVVLVIAAALAMLFNVFGVPGSGRSIAAPDGQPPVIDVMMVVDEILRTA